MNALKKAIDEVKFRIPRELLEKVFVDGSFSWRSTAIKSNVDQQILDLVIRPRVLIDCDLVGGVQMLVSLDGLNIETPNQYTSVIHIPKNRTDGRSIVSVLDVVFSSNTYGNGLFSNGQATAGLYAPFTGDNNAEGGAMMSALSSVMASADKIPMVSTSNVSLIAENTIMIRDYIVLTPMSVLRCVVGNEENMGSLQMKNYLHFSDLVTWAVKAYIYNQLVIMVDTAQLFYGKEVAAFKDIYMGYADAEQNYQEFLRTTMRKVLFMNDRGQYRRWLKLAVGGGH